MNENIKKENIFTKKPWIKSVSIMVLIFGLLGIFLYWESVRNTVFIENSYLEAPVVNLSPVTSGTLNALYVHVGDKIIQNTPVALVGTSVVTSKESGVVSYTPLALGGYFNTGMTVVTVIKTSEMRVVGSIEENKGFKDLVLGQNAMFTVDAFPGKDYYGNVDEIGQTSEDTGVVFSISDKRPIKKFNIKIKFDVSKYPELKNGMSAKITVLAK